MNKKQNVLKLLFLVVFAVAFIFSIFGIWETKETKAGSEHNVSGWAWSENIGWISFNNTSGGGSVNYGVKVDLSNGLFSGYAWSENIGWIWFAPTDIPPGEATANPVKLNLTTNEVSGWARACAGAANPDCTGGANPAAGGWDGWIKLRGTWTPGVTLNTTPNPDEFQGWAWGSDVVGWISFNCSNQGVCGTSNYKVVLGSPPTATPLAPTAEYCLTLPGTGQVQFAWTYSDPEGTPQQAYHLQVATDSGFLNKGVDCIVLQSVSSGETGTSQVNVVSSPSTDCALAKFQIGYGQAYYWRVKVQNSQGIWSDWAIYDANKDGPDSFTTPPHAYPRPNFLCNNNLCEDVTLGVGETVTFNDISTCYDSSHASYSCKNNSSNWYQWDFNNDGVIDCDSNIDTTCRGDVSTSYSQIKKYIVKLYITDDVGTCDHFEEVPVGLLPKWKEVAPISWLNNFLAMISAIFKNE
jgi:hypothetical protein